MENYGLWRWRWFRKLRIEVNVKLYFICENIIYNCENSLQDKFHDGEDLVFIVQTACWLLLHIVDTKIIYFESVNVIQLYLGD